MSQPSITPSQFANINEFYFYPGYSWRAVDFQNMQKWTYSTLGALAAGGFGPSVLNGYGISLNGSSMILNVAPGIAFNVNGIPMVLGSSTQVTVATPSGNPAWSLIVARPITTDNTLIVNPSNPTGAQVPLQTTLGVSIVCLNGTPSPSPAYPTPLSTDVVLMGLKIPSNTTVLTTGMFDSSQTYVPTDNTFNVAVTAPAFIPNGSSIPVNGMYSSGTNLVDFSCNSTNVLELSTVAILASVPYFSQLGSAANPTYTFTGRSTNGMYSPGANQVGLSTNGLQAIFIDSSQNVTFSGQITVTGAINSASTDNLVLSAGSGGVINLQTASTTRVQIAANGDVTFTPTSSGVQSSMSGAGTSLTNFVAPFTASNSSGTVNTWAGYNFYSTGSSSSAGVLALQSVDTTNHYGLIAIGTRGPGGYKAGLVVDQHQSVLAGLASPGTTATDGFLYIPVCAGTPTGTPTANSGYAPILFDSTNTKFWIYNGSAWKGVALS